MGLFDFIFGNKKTRDEQQRQERERMERLEQMLRVEKEKDERKNMLQNKRREEVIREAKAMGNNGKVYYILDFYLDCSHWREQNAILEKTPLALPVKRVDVDAEDDVVRKYKVSSLPKLILVDIDGNEIHRWKGITQSEVINEYLYQKGYATKKVSTSGKSEVEVKTPIAQGIVVKKNVTIAEGVTYNGNLKIENGKEVPHGYGAMKCHDHNEIGLFNNGVIDGIAYLNYHEWMCVGRVSDGKLNGWGVRARRGEVEFGVFENGELKVDITPLVEIYWDEILHKLGQTNFKMVSLRHRRKEIFIGVPQLTCGVDGDMGFHFLESGDVYLGISDIEDDPKSNSSLNGYFLHFDTEFNITCGKYDSSKLIARFEKNELAPKCHVFVDHRYLDFDINMNYAPSSFLFDKKKLYSIVELGQTNENLVALANPCVISDDGEQVRWDNKRNKETVWFVFPSDNDNIREQLEWISNDSEHPWIPDFDEYKVVFLNNLSEDNETLLNGNHLVMYKHKSCWEQDYDYALDNWDFADLEEYGLIETNNHNDEDDDDIRTMLSWIPNAFDKKYALENEWRNKGWYFTYSSVRDYVESLASTAEENDFYGWLFDDYRMRNCPYWSLTMEQKWAYNQFLELFPDSN